MRFDTRLLVKELEKAKFTEEQVEAIVNVFRKTQKKLDGYNLQCI